MLEFPVYACNIMVHRLGAKLFNTKFNTRRSFLTVSVPIPLDESSHRRSQLFPRYQGGTRGNVGRELASSAGRNCVEAIEKLVNFQGSFALKFYFPKLF